MALKTVTFGFTKASLVNPGKWLNLFCCMRHSSNSKVISKRNALFSKELARQNKLISRIEKIQVEIDDPSFGCTMIMNKNLSTPYDCARHISEMISGRSVLAKIEEDIWDMHRPLEKDCKIKFMHFKDKDPYFCNGAYWKSCSFILGYIIERAFKEDYYVELLGWPKPKISTGSFVCDANLKVKDWQPKAEELRTLSRIAWKLGKADLKFERLVVGEELALQMFEDNQYKSAQIPNIAAQRAEHNNTDPSVVVYRLGDHIDVSSGPLIPSTSHLGNFTITAAHQVESNGDLFYRFQGVSLPNVFTLSSFVYNILVERAKELNIGATKFENNFPKQHQEENNGEIEPEQLETKENIAKRT